MSSLNQNEGYPEALRNFLQTAEVVKISANTRFFLSDPDIVYLVKDNDGDVFAWEVDNENFVPLFLQEVAKANLMFGVRFEEKEKNNVFFFITSRETSLYKMARTRLTELIYHDKEVRHWASAVIEKWVGGLLSHFLSEAQESTIQKEFPIQGEVTIHAGERGKLQRVLDPEKKHCLGWIECVKGEIEIEGNEALRLSDKEHILFPLSPSLSFVAIQEAEVISTSTFDALRVDKSWEGLTVLHRALFQFFEIKKEEDVRRELHKIEMKRKIEFRSKEEAIASLGSILEKTQYLATTEEGNALFNACHLIGQVLGVKVIESLHSTATNLDGQVAAIASISGLFSRKIALKGQWWRIADAPILAFYGEANVPVALINVSSKEFEFTDPASRQKIKVNQANAQQFAPHGYSFHPIITDEKITFFSLLKFTFREAYWEGFPLIFIAILAAVVNLFLPYAMEELFDTLAATANTAVLLQLTLGLLLVAVSQWVFAIARNFAEQRLSGISTIKLEMGLWGRILNLPVSYFRKASAGELLNWYQSIVAVLAAVNQYTISAMFSVIYAFFYFIQMTTFSFYLTLVGLLGFVVSILIFVSCSLLQFRTLKPFTDLKGKIQGYVIQMISGLPKIRTAGAESRFFKFWSELFVKQNRLFLSFKQIQIVTNLSAQLFPMIATVVIYTFAIRIFDAEKDSTVQTLTIGQFVGFTTAFGLFVASGMDILSTIFASIGVLPLWKNAMPLILQPVEKGLEKPSAPALKGKVVIDHASYRYDPEGDLTLKDVSIEALPGELIGIIGPSGSGKSTLVRLLLGFEKPEMGAIYFDDKNLDELDPRSIRAQIGTVLQNAALIAGSIYENIVGSGTYSPEAIERAIYLSGFENDMKYLPMGLNTIIPMGGGSFSGGQKQRLLLARALVASPAVLILDEATSALDNKTQDFVSTNLDQLRLTRIVIAHRLSTVKNADRIYVLERGKVVQVGTFKGLAEQEGLFAAMLKRQLL